MKHLKLASKVALFGALAWSLQSANAASCTIFGTSPSTGVCRIDLSNVAGFINVNSELNNSDNAIEADTSGSDVLLNATNLNTYSAFFPFTIDNTSHLILDATSLSPGLNFAGGNDTLTNNTAGSGPQVTVIGDVYTGDGDDEADLVGVDLQGDVYGGSGNELLTLSASSSPFRRSIITGNIYAEDGNDEMDVSYTDITGNLESGVGDDILNFSTDSTVIGNIDGGDGDDVFEAINNVVQSSGTISGGAGNDEVRLGDSTSVQAVDMGDADDTLVIDSEYSGANPNEVTLNGSLTGGNGNDDVTFRNWDGVPPALLTWEELNLTNSSLVMALSTAVADTIFIDTNSSMEASGSLVMTTDAFINNGELRLFDQATATSDASAFINAGSVTSINNTTGDTPTIQGNLNSTGTIALDINTSTHGSDVLTVTGDNLGQIVIDINNLSLGTSDYQNIPLVTVNGNPGTAVLSGGLATYTSGVTYDLQLLANTWTLVPQAAPPAPGQVSNIPTTSTFGLLLLMGLSALGVGLRVRKK